tara:strand:- start:411 stop:986 length:576 start_codon:yes stop_codon:yes gene_type:complete
MVKKLLIGAGGHGKVVYDLLKSLKINIDQIFDPSHNISSLFNGIDHQIEDSWIKFENDECELYIGLGMNPLNKRTEIFKKAIDLSFKVPSIVHPYSYVAKDSVMLSSGVQVMAKSVIHPDVTIGDNTVINTASIIEHDVTVGKNCHIAPGAVICGGVKIGNDVFIGANSTICPNSIISDNSFIKANSLIKK